MSKRFETSSSAASGTSTLPRYNLSRRWFLISEAAGVRAFCEPCAGNDDLVRHLELFGLRCVSSGDMARGQDALSVFERFDAPVDPLAASGLLHCSSW